MGPPVNEVLKNRRVLKELLENPGSFSFKEAPTLILTMCSWPTHTLLRLEDMNSKIVLDGIPTNFPIAGPMSHVLEVLSTTINFTYLQVVPPDVSWGVRSANGSWSGMIRQVFEKEADVGLGPFQLIQSRAQDVDMTIPFSFDTLSLMVARGIGDVNPWGFLMPYSTGVWVAFFMSLLTVSFFHFIVESHYQQDKSWASIFGNALLEYSMPPMGHAITRKVFRSWQIPLFGCWVILAILLNSSYDGTLRSLMSLRHIPHPIQTLREAIDASSRKIIIEHRTSFTDIMGRVPSGDIYELDQAGKGGRYVDLKMRDFMRYSDLVSEEGHIQIFDMTTALRYFALHFSKTGRCNFYIGEEKFIPTMYAMTLQKNSPLTPAFNARIRKIFEGGFYKYWMTMDVANYTACANPPMKVPTRNPIGFGSIWGVAVIWGAGMSLAAMTFILEIITAKMNSKSHQEIKAFSPTVAATMNGTGIQMHFPSTTTSSIEI